MTGRFAFALVALLALGAVGRAQAGVTTPRPIDKAFFNAVAHDDLAAARELLARGARVDAREPPWNLTPLLIAPDVSLRMVKFLIRHRASVNTADREGKTVLMRAVFSTDPAMVAAVLAAHPRLDARAVWRNTALTYAVVQGNVAMVRMLIRAGADVNAERADGMRPLDMARRRLAAMRVLPPDAPKSLHVGMAMHHRGAMHEMPRAQLIRTSEEVLAMLQHAHARAGSGKMASIAVLHHCAPVSGAGAPGMAM